MVVVCGINGRFQEFWVGTWERLKTRFELRKRERRERKYFGGSDNVIFFLKRFDLVWVNDKGEVLHVTTRCTALSQKRSPQFFC